MRYEEEWQAWERLFAAAAHQDTPSEVPPAYICPLTMELYREPAITSAGQSYERANLQEHFQVMRRWLRPGVSCGSYRQQFGRDNAGTHRCAGLRNECLSACQDTSSAPLIDCLAAADAWSYLSSHVAWPGCSDGQWLAYLQPQAGNDFDPVTREKVKTGGGGHITINVGLRAATQQYLEEHPWAWKECF